MVASGFFVVAAHLGEDLVEGYPHRDRQAQLLPQHPADLVGQGLGVSAEEVEGAGYIQPALVDGEGSTRSVYRSYTALTRLE